MHYIGIDIAKQTHMAACRLSDGTPHGKAFSFTNDEPGFRSLLMRLDELEAGIEDSLVIMESTGWPSGSFWYPMASGLQ